jgi:hypothetical protein
MTDKNLDNNVAMQAMAKEAKELLEGRHAVVSQADRSIATVLVRALEVIAYGAPRTPQRSRHHGEDDPTGLPSEAQLQREREEALALLSPSQKRALGFPG